jgi:hypothetical protein
MNKQRDILLQEVLPTVQSKKRGKTVRIPCETKHFVLVRSNDLNNEKIILYMYMP